jgi:competence protein CoiA
MRYALDDKNNRIEVSSSGELGICEICNSNVKGRKGEQRVKHWYHHERKTIDCDNWHEPISEWHLKWQNYFPKKNREVTITRKQISHRADILLNNKLVIEIQNSPISFSDIEKRESFYGKNNLIWVLNGNTLANKSMLTEDVFHYNHRLSISIPKVFEFVENYDFKKILKAVLENTDLWYFKSDIDLFEIKDGNTLIFKFIDDKIQNFHLIEVQYKFYIVCFYERIYDQIELEKFRKLIDIQYSSIDEKICELRLIKKYWKKFIDKMKFPVFIDNLNGVKDNQLYYYSKNKVVDKIKFINHYLKYT